MTLDHDNSTQNIACLTHLIETEHYSAEYDRLLSKIHTAAIDLSGLSTASM